MYLSGIVGGLLESEGLAGKVEKEEEEEDGGRNNSSSVAGLGEA